MTDTETKLADALRYAVDNPDFDSAEFDRLAREALAALSAAHDAARAQPAITPNEIEWLEYVVAHMQEDSEPEDMCCAEVIQGLLSRLGSTLRGDITRPPAQPVSVPAGWQPIETAPCDGRLALVYRPLADMSGDKCIAIKRLIDGNNFCWPQTVPDGSTPTNPTADGACHVTHWMPLPEPPENER